MTASTERLIVVPSFRRHSRWPSHARGARHPRTRAAGCRCCSATVCVCVRVCVCGQSATVRSQRQRETRAGDRWRRPTRAEGGALSASAPSVKTTRMTDSMRTEMQQRTASISRARSATTNISAAMHIRPIPTRRRAKACGVRAGRRTRCAAMTMDRAPDRRTRSAQRRGSFRPRNSRSCSKSTRVESVPVFLPRRRVSRSSRLSGPSWALRSAKRPWRLTGTSWRPSALRGGLRP
jgi:hypothetical protein